MKINALFTFVLALSVSVLIPFASCQRDIVPEDKPDDGEKVDPGEKTDPVDEPDPDPDPLMITDREMMAKAWMAPASDGGFFASVENLRGLRYFHNGEYSKEVAAIGGADDIKGEFFYKDSLMRFLNVSDGYVMTLPAEGIEPDYTLAMYGMAFRWPNAKLRVSYERVTPYTQDEHGYGIYTGEWLDRYISNRNYIDQNRLAYYQSTVKNDKQMLPGYDVTVYSINAKGLEQPFYKIAIIRKEGQWARFGLLVYKSTTADNEKFDAIVRSWATFAGRGAVRNYFPVQQAREDPLWSETTRNYYRKLLGQQTMDFGVFSASMTSKDKSGYDAAFERISNEMARLQGPQGLDHNYEIIATYNHISWYGDSFHFPTDMAEHFAAGDGFNGRPVLEFSYQFTTNNNNVSSYNTTQCQTPMFDILRGRYDLDFKALADEIKAYGKPVLFRLNNEMNTDWTSYCGMMTLVDPDIFIDTWRHLYDIFKERGVDNCIWIFNPNGVSCPHSRWGEDLPYYPGNDYVQAFGLTNYEQNNSEWGFESFRERYTYLYNKSNDLFGKMPWIIGEFACGAGGQTTGELGRYQQRQAQWVRDMFTDIKNREPYAANIKGAVWFSANDYSGDQISNYFYLDESLQLTLQAFRDGFSSLAE